MASSRPKCKYGEQCYRKNSAHLQQYWHPPEKRKRDGGDQGEGEDRPLKRGDSNKPNALHVTRTLPGSTSDGVDQDSQQSVGGSQQSVGGSQQSVGGGQQSVGGSQHSVGATKTKAQSEAQEGLFVATDAVDCSEEEDDASLDWPERLQRKFGVPFPDDFFSLWEFCKVKHPTNPRGALTDVLGLTLVGPYDFLSGAMDSVPRKEYISCHLHWRYFYDPPELLTVIRGSDQTGHHLGYFRDEPADLPCCVVENHAARNCELRAVGKTLFVAVKSILTSCQKTETDQQKQGYLAQLDKDLAAFASAHNISLTAAGSATKRKTVAKTFNRFGIVVPYDKKQDIGYRPLPLHDRALRQLLDSIAASESADERNKRSEKLEEIIMFVQFANDECDYGMGFELGMDLFCHGGRVFHGQVVNLLQLAYDLLGRDVFGKIIGLHMRHRTRHVQNKGENIASVS